MSMKNVEVFRRCFIFADNITFLLTIDNANLVFVINCLKIKKIIIIILFHLIERNCVSTREGRSVLNWVATELRRSMNFIILTR